MAEQQPRVHGAYCPMGCGETLFLGVDNLLTCSWSECPRPDAAYAILADSETEHVVTLREQDFTIMHPLQERLDDALLDCDLHEVLRSYAGPPSAPGRYRVTHIGHDPVSSSLGGDWQWERLDG